MSLWRAFRPFNLAEAQEWLRHIPFHQTVLLGESVEEETPEFYERLNAVITRARAVNIDGNRNAVAAGPFGPLWADDTRALIEFNDEQMKIAA